MGEKEGPRTPEGLARMRRAKTVHGSYSEETRRLKQYIRALAKEARQAVEKL